jgi:hypothetical protein
MPQHVCRCQAAEQSLPDDNSAAPARQQQEEELQDSDSMAQYEQLKADMNRTTRRFAAFLSGYLLLTTTSDVSALDAHAPQYRSAAQTMQLSTVMQTLRSADEQLYITSQASNRQWIACGSVRQHDDPKVHRLQHRWRCARGSAALRGTATCSC